MNKWPVQHNPQDLHNLFACDASVPSMWVNRNTLPSRWEGYLRFENAELYFRETGQGKPILLLHGGPDFDYRYLLPEMDRLSNSFRLIYYDQRGRGRSARDVQPGEVSLQTEIEDTERLRGYFGLESLTVLGYSWGGLLDPGICAPPSGTGVAFDLDELAPSSHKGYTLFREQRRKQVAIDVEELKARSSEAMYQVSDPEAVAG